MKNKKTDITTSRNKILNLIKYESYFFCDDLSYKMILEDLQNSKNDFERKEVLTNALSFYFQNLCENEEVNNVKDKEGSIERLYRACHFENEIFGETFDEVFDYVFNDINPESNS